MLKLKKLEYLLRDILSNNEDFGPDENKKIETLVEEITLKVWGVLEATEDLEKDTTTSLIFKYHSLSSLSELEKFSKDLKQCIEIPLHILAGNDNNVEILLIEEGSIVLTISFGAGLLIITKIIDLAFKYKRKWEEEKRNELYTRSLGLDVQLKETVVKAMEEQVKEYLQTESESLTKEHIDHADNQKIETIKNSIKILNELLNKELSIKPALNAPVAVQEKFEEFKILDNNVQLQLPDNTI